MPTNEEGIPYVDERGQHCTTGCWVVESYQDWRLYERYGGYDYVAFRGEWDFGFLEFQRNTTMLILMDGCKVTTNTVVIHGSNNADGLTIYGQEQNTGSLKVTKEAP